MSEHEQDSRHYRSAASLIRVHGILAIVFGAIGIAFSLLLTLLFTFGITDPNSSYQVISAFITALLVVIFVVLPHVYLLISGIHLLREPRPVVAKTLIIINLIVGVFYNLVILIFAIINLTQIADYEHGHQHHRNKAV